MDLPQHEYEAIRRAIPIACVDLVIINANREVLLVRRVNEPARGEWWFPGGRVHLNETRETAAKRILLRECGLRAVRLDELATLDVILPRESECSISHGITTVYATDVGPSIDVALDSQAEAFAWRDIELWREQSLHPVVLKILSIFQRHLPDSARGLAAE